jgi:hypothetical protein
MNRYILLKSVVFLFVLLLPASRVCEGQAQWGKSPSERNLMKHLREIANYARYLREDCEESLIPAERVLLDSINRQAGDMLTKVPQYLKAAWEASPPDGSDEHRKAVDNYNQILLWFDTAMLAENAPSDIPLFNKIVDTLGKTLAFISEDVRLKYLASRSGKELVKVQVKVTGPAGTEQPGYHVFVKPYISSGPTQITAVDPLNGNVSAGWKLCWIEKDGQRLQQQQWRVNSVDTSTHRLVFILK